MLPYVYTRPPKKPRRLKTFFLQLIIFMSAHLGYGILGVDEVQLAVELYIRYDLDGSALKLTILL